jgi:hypothetical protein
MYNNLLSLITRSTSVSPGGIHEMSAYSSRWDEALILLDSTSFKVATNNKANEAHAVPQHARELAVAPTEAY